MPRDFANGLKVGDIITVYDRGFMKVVDIVKNYYNNSHYIPRYWDNETKTYVQPALGDEDWSTIYYRAVYTNAGKKFKYEQPRFSALANQCFKAEAVSFLSQASNAHFCCDFLRSTFLAVFSFLPLSHIGRY